MQDDKKARDDNASKEQNSVEWFEELESPLIAYAYGILQNREDACDQVQEAFHRFYSQDAIIKHPKAWLYRTLRNLCISQIRKQKRLQMEGEEKQLDFFSAEANPETAEGNPLEKLEKSEQILIMKHHLFYYRKRILTFWYSNSKKDELCTNFRSLRNQFGECGLQTASSHSGFV